MTHPKVIAQAVKAVKSQTIKAAEVARYYAFKSKNLATIREGRGPTGVSQADSTKQLPVMLQNSFITLNLINLPRSRGKLSRKRVPLRLSLSNTALL